MGEKCKTNEKKRHVDKKRKRKKNEARGKNIESMKAKFLEGKKRQEKNMKTSRT